MKKVLVLSLLTIISALVSIPSWGAVTNGTSGDVNWSYDSSTKILTISGTGAMGDYVDQSSGTPSTSRRPSTWGSATSLVIEEGVTYVGQYAFHNCSSITSVTIPISMKRFGESAFKGCSNQNIFYAGTPSDWAGIEFEVVGNYAYSHPFYGGSTSNHKFYFYAQTTTENKVIVFHQGLTTIKPYTFYNAGRITDVCIPQSVTSIGTKAFYYCTALNAVTVLNTTAPTAETDAFDHMAGTTSCLYVPSGANASTTAPGFKRLPWYDSSDSRKGAAYIGYNNDDVSATPTGNNFGFGKVYPLSGTVDGISWSLSLDGVLTLEGHGELRNNFAGTSWTSSNLLPWARFRRMINKVIIKDNEGDITSLGNAIQYSFSLEDIYIEQTTIPECGIVAANSAPSFGGLFDKRSNIFVNLHVSFASLLLPDEAVKLGLTPWNDARVKIILEDKAYVYENEDNTDVLTAINTYIEAPFTMEFKRTLTNASYNTFCSPIPLTAAQLDGADIRALESSSYNDATEVLWLQFSKNPLSVIEAGVPYLIQPSSAISNPTFTNVEPNSVVATASFVNTDHVKFHGVLAPTSLTGGDKNTLFLGAGNELFWPEATGNIKGLRAYFEVKEGSGARRALRARMSMDGHNTPTDFESIQTSAVRSQKVLRDGKLYIMHNGQMYDVQGRRL